MFLKDKIFSHVNLLKVSFSTTSLYRCELMRCRYRGNKIEPHEDAAEGEIEMLLNDDKLVPYIIVYTGHGIISKSRDALPAKLLEKLTPGDTEFLWTEDAGGKITLLRREQVEEIGKTAEESGARLIGTTVCDGEKDSYITQRAAEYLNHILTFKRFLKTDRTGSELARLVYDKLKLAVLALILILLTANYFIGDKARAELGRLQMEAQAQQRTIGAAGETVRQKNALFEKYNRYIPLGFSWICDRMAIVLPETILLNSLKLQPLAKKLEAGKEVEFYERQVEVSGNAGNTEDIMLYISALKKLGFAKEVRMVSFEQERNSSDLFFKLMLFL